MNMNTQYINVFTL